MIGKNEKIEHKGSAIFIFPSIVFWSSPNNIPFDIFLTISLYDDIVLSVTSTSICRPI